MDSNAYRKELAERIERALPEDGGVEPLKGLHLFRSSTPTEPLHGVYASQFSREYKRLFGQPPMRDLERLREAARS